MQKNPARFATLRSHIIFLVLAAITGLILLPRAPRDASPPHPTDSGYARTPAGDLRITPLTYSGYPTVIDGDTLRIGNEKIRLLGLDAPELHQTCEDESGQSWQCGREARTQLQLLLAQGEVRCTSSARDRYGRVLATCSAGAIGDVGEALVRAGYAVDYSRALFGTYRSAERDAQAARRGIWRGKFERPENWRARHPWRS